ncbi:decaprenyl-phosphate phosphoribosyltransferase [Aquibacillus salsiterrae]|uniref:Decaprenyl-phosphate phosphoribosyltransferase n=1 Tax=Aquibacillus salsiterrae TaxID=2950439 RepID=A0A9X4AEF0_9BACI|nr:decaprenyl-phosphate phosphoribosyltransferase [Aquibacillus salsiterrae]MDC3416696.1 decaprenyl-phosphate phosphoribosyltransferase [Aquibacillus salsiterrae]
MGEIVLAKQSVLAALWMQLRPKQWAKNVLVFAALLFSFRIVQLDAVILSIYGFISFCFTASSIYIMNDYNDREADRHHPEKKHRPMASGVLDPKLAIVAGFLLLLLALGSSFVLNKLYFTVLLIYFVMNLLYSFWLKHVVIIDIMIIAAGFVLRAIGGAVIINVPFTPWFLLCAMLLSLFLAIGKRRHELSLVLEKESSGSHRKVLNDYTITLLDQMTSIVTAATIVSYAVFTFTSGNTVHLMWTIPFVIYGMFRYLYLIHVEQKGGAPERILLEDKHILVTVILYAVAVVIIFAIFE